MQGSRIGPYEVGQPLGAGGMGEVYRGRDTRLDRDVALKVLPEGFASDPERLARFEREAKTLAALNHQHIAQVYGLEQADSTVIVMELVEGQDLAQRLESGPIPVEEALAIARQIAEALEAAHEAGIVHRDLKPANVKVRPDGTVKVLDFGLAKAADTSTASGSEIANSPTLMSPAATAAGVIMGTAAYMAPEQAKGRPLGPRADIWAFGVMLHEMLTGRRLFEGETVAETLAAVLRGEIELDDLPADTPASVRWLIERCLQRDPKQRLGAIGEAARILGDPQGALPAASVGAAPSQPSRLPGWIAASLVVGALLGALGLGFLRSDRTIGSRNVQRFTLPAEGRADDFRSYFGRAVYLSQDGTLLSYTDPSTVPSTQWVRPIGQLEATRLPLQDVADLQFSPDGTLYAALGNSSTVAGLVRGPVDGGAPEMVAERCTGLAWTSDGALVFTDGESLWRASRLGTPERVADIQDLEDRQGEEARLFVGMSLLPGDDVALTTAITQASNFASPLTAVVAVSLESGEVLAEIASSAAAGTWLPTGHVVFARGSSVGNLALFAAPFDPNLLEVTGEPVPVVRDLNTAPVLPLAQYAVSAEGTLAYVQDSGVNVTSHAVVRVLPGDQTEELLRDDSVRMERPRLSPDGRQLAVQSLDASNGLDIWVYDLERAGARLRLTEGGTNYDPVWSTDGRWIYYSGTTGTLEQIYARRADAGEPPRQILESQLNVNPYSWHPEGDRLAVYERELNERDIAVLYPNEEPPRLEPFLATPANERSPAFSPDGRWLAYASDTSGRDEIYVTDYPDRSIIRAVSTTGGREPVWDPRGGALFYRRGDEFYRVEVAAEPELTLGPPELFASGRYTQEMAVDSGSQSYDVGPDGSLIVIQPTSVDDTPGAIVVVTNWFGELKRLAPVDR